MNSPENEKRDMPEPRRADDFVTQPVKPLVMTGLTIIGDGLYKSTDRDGNPLFVLIEVQGKL